MIEQMVALVEHDRLDAGLDQALHELAGARVQRRRQGSGILTGQGAPHGPRPGTDAATVRRGIALAQIVEPLVRLLVRAVVGDELLRPSCTGQSRERLIGVEDAEHLIRQRREGGRARRVVGHRRLVVRQGTCGGDPLGADGRGGGEHDRPPTAARGEEESEQRLS